ncbi:glutamate-1-semialdehyde 2, 1-aminomutase [Colletotrichum karsti]|uniref:Glutamate-1-semialdehyde 2, 1-aminomutase n=1 Tax=Colletotrichum karsti TaxID=1095194 RepID=A0A9P6IG60_9PEZI|nr:glutamate-1-semialdehyde 2, 1-aminomutase [Colletotrichum karsti]KAF9882274.1 glutamate-1-semialdehyde 2, 1-aminomutase [Colletotrichum karsti]
MAPNIVVVQNANEIDPENHDGAGVYSDFVGTKTGEHALTAGVWDIYDFEEQTPSGVSETTEVKYIIRGEAVIKNEWTGETYTLKPGSLLWIPVGAKMSLIKSNNCRAIYAEVRHMVDVNAEGDGEDHGNALQSHLESLIAKFIENNPSSRKAIERARVGIPGGNTRSVLDCEPFPLVVKSGKGATLTSVDGKTFTDFQSDFTAGLFGHSNPELEEAITNAARNGLSFGAVTELESELSESIKQRFASIDQIRYCNSGTEANIYAIAAGLVYSGRQKVLVFDHGYHGGTLSFGDRPNLLNIPHSYVVGTFNDIEKTQPLLTEEIGVIIIEPMQSAGGMRPASKEFLTFLRESASVRGAVLIFDEVVTSRLDYHGMQGKLDIQPDLTTLGKYLGGGLPFGAFGGKRDIMAQFDSKSDASVKLSHSGTFNNNVLTMSAAVVAGKLVTESAIKRINKLGDRVRDGVNAAVQASGKDVKIIGLGVGSCVGLYFPGPEGDSLREVLFFHLLEDGVWIGRRGFLALNFAHTDEDVDQFLDGFKTFLESYA